MNKNDIIQHIISLQIVEKLTSRFSNILKEYCDDFKQYIYLQILEMEESKLIELYNKNELIYYIIAVARNNALGSNSKFRKIHIDTNLEYDNIEEKYENTQSIL